MPVILWPNQGLREGMNLALPMGGQATIQTVPKIGTKFVTFRTEHGPTRVSKNDLSFIEVGAWYEVGFFDCPLGCKKYAKVGVPGITANAHSSSYGCKREPQQLPTDVQLSEMAVERWG